MNPETPPVSALLSAVTFIDSATACLSALAGGGAIDNAPQRAIQLGTEESLGSDVISLWKLFVGEAMLRVSMSSDYLSSMKPLLAPYKEEHALGLSILARSSLEVASRARWVLAPGITMRERISRGATEHLYGLKEKRKLLSSDTELWNDATGDIERFAKKMDSLGILLPARLTATESVQRTLAPDGARDSRFDIIYRSFSASPHGNLHITLLEGGHESPLKSVFLAAKGIIHCAHTVAEYTGAQTDSNAYQVFQRSSEKALEEVKEAWKIVGPNPVGRS